MSNPDAFTHATAAATAIGRAVLEHLNAHAPSGPEGDEALWAAHWSPGFESIEASGESWKGIDAVREKCRQWYDQFTVHDFSAEGPYVTSDGFAMKYTMEIEGKQGMPPRMKTSEIAVYTVADGKVIREQFFNLPMDG